MQIVSWGTLNEMSKSIFQEKQENFFKIASAVIFTQHAKH